jgi:phosphoglycerate dehydrogenase-like enzyme
MMDFGRRSGKLKIVIASPLEDEYVARIRAFDPERIEVLNEPDLLPTPRYVADHIGIPKDLTLEQRQRWAEMLRKADILFDFDRTDPANLPTNAPRLRWVQATSSGIGEFLKRTGLDRSNILFTTAAGVHARPLAEFALLGLLYFFRDVPQLEAFKRARRWERYTVDGLDGKRALIVGMGAVGREIARQCASLGVEVWGTRGSVSRDRPEGLSRWIDNGSLKDTVPEVDALILACPMTENTRGLIDAEILDALRPGAVLVNVARGGVIDEESMIRGLSSGRIKGAALDVFAVEPLPQESTLWDLPNVIFSPHSASTVAAENSRIVDLFLENLGSFLAGRSLRNRFVPERGY